MNLIHYICKKKKKNFGQNYILPPNFSSFPAHILTKIKTIKKKNSSNFSLVDKVAKGLLSKILDHWLNLIQWSRSLCVSSSCLSLSYFFTKISSLFHSWISNSQSRCSRSSFSHNSLFNHTTCSSLSTKACSSPKLITVARLSSPPPKARRCHHRSSSSTTHTKKRREDEEDPAS